MSEIAVLGANRFGLGLRPGDLAGFAADPKGALLEEISDITVAMLDSGKLPDSAEALPALREQRRQRRMRQDDGREADDISVDAGDSMASSAMPKPEGQSGNALRTQQQAEFAARLRRGLEAPIGMGERLTLFWSNHFAVKTGASAVVRALAGSYERDAIRPHILGKFSDMLYAATRHPAMLAYLNNATSVGPQSPQGKRRERGLNENHARELMELHTLGVDGGYSQADVTALANILTGWTFGTRPQAKGFGTFQFNRRAHEPGAQEVMGVRYDQRGERQGEAVLSMLAAQEATAGHIAYKLARHFIADQPPPEMVSTLSRRFLDSGGDLMEVTKALLSADEAWTAPPVKLRSPQEFVLAAMRALGLKPVAGLARKALDVLGQPLWNPPSPEGYHDDVATWLAPDAMTNRLDIAEQLADRSQVDDPRILADEIIGARLSQTSRQAIERAESPVQGLALLLMSPEFQRR